MKLRHIPPFRTLLHRAFEVGILVKGFDGVTETIGGVLLLFIKPEQMSHFVWLMVREELSEDPHDLVANFLMRMVSHLSVSTEVFGAIYLIIHGVIKVFLVISLWRSYLWAYPTAIVLFIAFMVYQVYRYTHTHAVGLLALTVLDVFVIALTWMEYQRLKAQKQGARDDAE